MARSALKAEAGSIDLLIAARQATPALGFEPILHSSNERTINARVAESILYKGYPVRPSYLFKMGMPMPWNHPDRTVGYNLNSFAPLSTLLAEYTHTGDARYINASLSFLDDWLGYVRPPDQTELTGRWNESSKDFLWYDMAVGLRAYKLAYMIDVMMRMPAPDVKKLDRLMAVLDWHRQVLSRDETFCDHNNHGLYQALGQIAMCRRFRDVPGFEECLKQGEDRLDAMIRQQFFPDGVHREHSPGYQWMLFTTLQEAMRAGLIVRDDHLAMIARIEETLSWFIQPNLRLAAFGDTDGGEFIYSHYKSGAFTHPDLRYVLSEGSDGTPPAQEFRVFEDAGYAVQRTINPKSGKIETYLAQAAGFHSKTHKHADHLSFIWYDRGQDILVDAGRFGYKGKTEPGSGLWQQGFWYSDPQRIYVEKTRAHNCVEIDGQDYPRRGATPFGSAITRTAKAEHHIHAIETDCRHFQSIRHNRVLFICPRRFLIVLDWLKDNKDIAHDFRQWFHLAPNLDLSAERDRMTILRKGKPFASVLSLVPDIALDKIARGQSEPDMQGWVSHDKGGSLLPNWAFSMSAAERAQTCFATLFTLYPDATLAQPAQIAPSGQSGKLFWQDRSGLNTFSFTRKPGEAIKMNYKRVATG